MCRRRPRSLGGRTRGPPPASPPEQLSAWRSRHPRRHGQRHRPNLLPALGRPDHGEVGRCNDADWATDQERATAGCSPLPRCLNQETSAPSTAPETPATSPKPLVAACRLNDVAPDGRSTPRSAARLLNLTHRDSHEHAAPLTRPTPRRSDNRHASPQATASPQFPPPTTPIAWPSPELATLTIHLGQSLSPSPSAHQSKTLPSPPPLAPPSARRKPRTPTTRLKTHPCAASPETCSPAK